MSVCLSRSLKQVLPMHAIESTSCWDSPSLC